MKKLKHYDLEKLESYWRRYPEHVKAVETEKSPIRKQNLSILKESIEKLFNEANDDMKKVVEITLWADYEPWEVTEFLRMPRSKITRMKEHLLKETAESIGWV